MSAKFEKPVKKPENNAIGRPIGPGILQRARAISAQYRIVLEPQDDGGYLGRCLEMPLVMGDGKTPDACVEMTRDAIVGVVGYMLEQRQSPPAPARDRARDQQINIRLTIEEKALLEEAARQQGFRGVSDFVRSRSLQELRT